MGEGENGPLVLNQLGEDHGRGESIRSNRRREVGRIGNKRVWKYGGGWELAAWRPKKVEGSREWT